MTTTAPAPVATPLPSRAQRRRHRRRRPLDRTRRVLVGTLAAAYVVLPGGLAEPPPPIRVLVGEEARLLPPGITLGELATYESLKPPAGDFVDVKGAVIESGRYPGHLTVNGERASAGIVLAEGDAVRVEPGADRREGVTRQVVRVPGGMAANPQSFLGSVPGEQVITRGAVSGKVVSSVFRPTGPADVPRKVALTFDDGPSPSFTPRILDILERHGVEATFFVVGTMAERYPKLVRRAARAGSVGNHTYGHPVGDSFAKLGAKRIREEIHRADRILRGIGIEPVGFRPPGGSSSELVLREARARGMRTVLWAIDSRDWTRPSPEALVKHVLREARPGAIILLHDGGGDRSATVAALPRIIKGLRKKGLEPVALQP